jgi:hypothetical protein
MSATQTPIIPSPNSDDERLDEALEDTFPASDAVQTSPHEKLPPADAPGSDVHDR